jgi:hypothetical protein
MGVIKLIDTRFITVEEHTGVDHIIYLRQILYISAKADSDDTPPLHTTADQQLYPGTE